MGAGLATVNPLAPSAGPPLRSPGITLRGPGQSGPGYAGFTGPGVLGFYGPGMMLPMIHTPGLGPNGPGPIDNATPITSVGWASSVPYGPTNGYATPNGVTGFIGPAAGSLQRPTAWYVRAAGSDNNGGTTNSLNAYQVRDGRGDE